MENGEKRDTESDERVQEPYRDECLREGDTGAGAGLPGVPDTS